MMLFKNLFRMFNRRLRYPVSCPEDIAESLGITLTNSLIFPELLHNLTAPSCKPLRLSKFMSRDDAEAAFINPQRCERFNDTTIISYYFLEGWLEFKLHYDSCGKLRRLYLQHCQIPNDIGIEINLITPSSMPTLFAGQKYFLNNKTSTPWAANP